MRVAHLSLVDFRSYAAVELPLDPGVTAFVGANGQGKTNLVEAIGYLASLSSHRVAADAALVRSGAERAIIRAKVAREDRIALLEIEINPGRANRARINSSPLPRARELLGVLRTVLFAPEDLALVKGDPTDRRRFLDELLVLRTPRLAGVRADYDRVLKQRNALLKTSSSARRAARGGGENDLSTLEVWDQHLVAAGAEIVAARLALVAELAPLVSASYASVAPTGGATELTYKSSLGEDLPHHDDRAALEATMTAALLDVRRQEMDRGISLVGPHRDELVLTLQGLPAKGYASHGESWSFALALRLAAYDLLRADDSVGAEPVLVLDDVFAELDTSRRHRLAELVAGAEQVLVTAAVDEDVPPELAGARVDVAGGEVRPVT